LLYILTAPICLPRLCVRPCPLGYVADKNGCQTCICKRKLT
jgi:hypothetical protein